MNDMTVPAFDQNYAQHPSAQTERAHIVLKKWRNSERLWPRVKRKLTDIFCTCAASGCASHLGCIINIAGTSLLSATGGSVKWIPVLQTASYAVPIGLSAVAWWGMEKLRPSTSFNERRNRKWAAGIGCAITMGITAAYNHHNYVDEYQYFAEQSLEKQQMIRDAAKGYIMNGKKRDLSPVEYIRESGLCQTRPNFFQRFKDSLTL